MLKMNPHVEYEGYGTRHQPASDGSGLSDGLTVVGGLMLFWTLMLLLLAVGFLFG